MKNWKTKIAAVGLAALAVGAVPAPAVVAWGPDRPTYTNEHPADHATFNSITDNAAVGDERDFVRIVEVGSKKPYTSDLEIEAGKDYEVFIYYHNDASKTFNDKDHNRVGIALNVRVATDFPDEMKAGQTKQVVAIISSTNAEPKEVWDEANITAKEDITLHYVAASAKIYNQWKANGSVLPTSIFSEKGTFIGLNELNGMILGCDEYSGTVLYRIRTEAVEKDPEPEPPVEPEKPDEPAKPDEPDEPVKPEEPGELPEELPNTGPLEIGLAIVIVTAIIAGAIYWGKTHSTVRKVTRKAKGKK